MKEWTLYHTLQVILVNCSHVQELCLDTKGFQLSNSIFVEALFWNFDSAPFGLLWLRSATGSTFLWIVGSCWLELLL